MDLPPPLAPPAPSAPLIPTGDDAAPAGPIARDDGAPSLAEVANVADLPDDVNPTPTPAVHVRPEQDIPASAVADDVDYDAFAHEPPFRPRRNPARMWTLAAVAAALVLLGGVGALQYFGTPTWLARLGLPIGETDVPLLLQVPRKPDRRTLPSGNELFALTGRVVNPTTESQRVPDILAELRDAQGRVVYGWTITPPRRTIAAKASMEFDSAEIDVPKGAKALNLSFSGETPK